MKQERTHRRRLAAAVLVMMTTATLTGCDALAEVFPKAFESAASTASEEPTAKASPAPANEWKTVTTTAGDFSFSVRTDWSVHPAPGNQARSTTGIASYEVKDADGRLLATLQQNPGASTPAALPGSTFTPIDSVPAPEATYLGKADSAVVLDLTTHPNGDSVLSYGLTAGRAATAAEAGGRAPLGGGTQGYPKLAGPLRFEGRVDLGQDAKPTRTTEALEAAKAYVFTQEYADLVFMLQSLRYHSVQEATAECSGASFTYRASNVDCDTVLDVYHTARIAEEFDSRSGATVRVQENWLCTLKELGAKMDGQPRGYGLDGECRLDGAYGSFTASWTER